MKGKLFCNAVIAYTEYYQSLGLHFIPSNVTTVYITGYFIGYHVEPLITL